MSSSSFTLDPVLGDDTHVIGDLELCRVLLMDDARFPWLILVPRRDNKAELIDLGEADRVLLMNEIFAASNALKAIFNPDKLNVAALGNQVKQLHIHVIARFVSDEAWPRPVWGMGTRQPYPPHMAGSLLGRIADALSTEEVAG